MQLTTDVAPCTPLPSLPRHVAQRHEVTDPTASLPSLCLSIGSPGPYPITRNEKSSVNHQSYASKLFTYPHAVQSSCPLSPNLPKSLKANQINSQSPLSEVYDGNLPSLLRPNQPVNSHEAHYNKLSLGPSRPNQPVNSREAHHNQLSLGPSSGEILNQKNSCISRFSFIEALTSENTDDVQLGQQENVIYHSILPEHDGRIAICCSPSKGRSESIQFFSEKTSKKFDLQHDDSIETFKGSHCASSSHRTTNCIISSQASKVVLIDHSRESSSFLHSTQPKEATLSLSQVLPTSISEPSVIKTKQDWNALKSIEYVQMLPDIFAQQKENVKQLDILSENNLNDRGNPEKRCKLLFSEGNTGPSSCGENNAKLLAQTEYMATRQGDQHSCGLGSIGANIKWNDERLVNAKVESETKQEPMENKIVRENSCADVATLNSPSRLHAGNSVLSENTKHMDETKSIELVNCSSLAKELTSGVNDLQGFPRQQELEKNVVEWGESTPVSIVKGSLVVDGDWGKFLALSATPVPVVQSTAERSCEVLPFQQRFKQLQTFLKQCDESDQTYCLEGIAHDLLLF